MKKIITILTMMTLTGCAQLNKPIPFGMFRGMQDGAPEGTETFRAGWKDGCETGMAAYGSLHYKATHGFEYDETRLQNNEYHAAWRIGFRHCRWYTAEWIR